MLRRRAAIKLRTAIFAVLLVALMPTAVCSLGIVYLLWKQQTDEVRRGREETSRLLAIAVEREINGTITALQALSASTLLSQGNLAAFHAEARRVVRGQREWQGLAVFGDNGERVLDSRTEFGAPLPEGLSNLSGVGRVMTTLRPAVSDVHVSPLTTTPVVDIAVPVAFDGGIRYVLVAILEANAFQSVLTPEFVRTDGFAAIVDGQFRFVARSRSAERFIGRGPVLEFLEEMKRVPQGIGRYAAFEGQPVYSAWKRTDPGWTVTVGMPADTIDASLRPSLIAMTGLGVAILGGATITAAVVSRRVSRSIGRAAQTAEGIGGGVRSSSTSSFVEIRRLHSALTAASDLLDAERQNRQRAETERDELRTPLAAIAAATTVLERTGRADEIAASSRGIIRRQTRHMTRVVDDLLDAARVSAGKVALHREAADVGEVVGRCLAVLAGAGELGRHHVTSRTESVWASVDVVRLEQVVNNLLTNALRYTPAGGKVHVSVSGENGHAVIRVADTGIGMDADLLPRVFDAFVQAPRAGDRRVGGLGIGLTLVRRLVELHDGFVSAQSDGLGHGSEFTVRLPSVAPKATMSEARATEPETRRLRIVLVEDNDDAREAVRLMLELDGHEVYDAASGPRGLEIILAQRPDVALIDIGLPGLDGYAVAAGIRAESVPVRLIALTGYGQPEDQRRAIAAGFDAFVVKPINPVSLAAALSPPSA